MATAQVAHASLSPAVEVSNEAAHRLRRLHLVMGLAHGLQATAMILLSNDVSLPITAAFATGPPGRPEHAPVIEELFRYRLGIAVALFSLLSAAFHLLVASPWGFPRYRRELAAARNRFRWVEFSLSASVMVVLIAGITGVTDVVALTALFGVNTAMILFGWLMETTCPRRPALAWSPFIFGCITGAFPWAGLLVYLVGAGGDVPGFVYGIYVSLYVLFNCFAVNQWLQYRARGRWADYLHGERVYVWLSLTAKSLLAWQVFANILTGS
jgi:hypothetical protein